MDSTETEALLVRSVDYRETDRIVTLMTVELGKIGAIAYGARRSKQRFPGALQPFQLLRVVVRPKRSRELLELVEAEVIEAYRSIPTDTKRHACAAFALELAREVAAEGERDRRTVEGLVTFLRMIDAEGPSPGALASVLLFLLGHAGFAPALDRCASCGREAPHGKAGHFETNRGIVCTSCGGSGPLIHGGVREALIRSAQWKRPTTCTDEALASAVRLLCFFAHEQIGKKLKSWALLDVYLGQMGQKVG